MKNAEMTPNTILELSRALRTVVETREELAPEFKEDMRYQIDVSDMDAVVRYDDAVHDLITICAQFFNQVINEGHQS